MNLQQAPRVLLAAALSLLAACDVSDIDLPSVDSVKASVQEALEQHVGIDRDLQGALADLGRELESLTVQDILNMNLQDMEERTQAEVLRLLDGMTAEELIAELRGMSVDEILAQANGHMTLEELMAEVRGMTPEEILAKLREN